MKLSQKLSGQHCWRAGGVFLTLLMSCLWQIQGQQKLLINLWCANAYSDWGKRTKRKEDSPQPPPLQQVLISCNRNPFEDCLPLSGNQTLDTNSLLYDIDNSDPKLFLALSNKLNIFVYPSLLSSLNVAKGIGGTVSCSTLSSYSLRHCAPKCEVAQTPCCCLHPVCYRAEDCGRISRFKGVLRFIYILRLISLETKRNKQCYYEGFIFLNRPL